MNYPYQKGEGGIAKALGVPEFFSGGEPICVVLGDNIVETNICHAVGIEEKLIHQMAPL